MRKGFPVTAFYVAGGLPAIPPFYGVALAILWMCLTGSRLVKKGWAMSYLLCHDCYAWVEPRDNRCSECLAVMDMSAADPPLRQLREVMGDIMQRLGEVRIRRPMLPEWGTLYATTQGLFFVPHEVDQTLASAAGPFTGTSLMWTLGSLFWSPLAFLMPFLGGEDSQESLVRVLRPRQLAIADSAQMPVLLMENPGALFLPKPQIRAITRKRTLWRIERSIGSRLLLSPLESPRMFQENISRLLAAPAWHLVGE